MKKNSICRRLFCKGLFCAILAIPLFSGAVFGAETPKPAKKALVVYFSESGNTRKLADAIQKQTGADIVEIKTVKPYPEDYNTLTDYAKKELQAGVKPELSTAIPDLSEYEIIYLGFPNWWSSVPMPVHTFADQSKLDGKTVAPFVTHGGGGLGHIESDLKKMLPNSKILKPFSAHGTRAGSVGGDVEKWLQGLSK